MDKNVDQATRCPACKTVFRVVPDQLRVSEGWVRCGRCGNVFNAQESRVDMDGGWGRAGEDTADAPPAPSVDARPPLEIRRGTERPTHRARQDADIDLPLELPSSATVQSPVPPPPTSPGEFAASDKARSAPAFGLTYRKRPQLAAPAGPAASPAARPTPPPKAPPAASLASTPALTPAATADEPSGAASPPAAAFSAPSPAAVPREVPRQVPRQLPQPLPQPVPQPVPQSLPASGASAVEATAAATSAAVVATATAPVIAAIPVNVVETDFDPTEVEPQPAAKPAARYPEAAEQTTIPDPLLPTTSWAATQPADDLAMVSTGLPEALPMAEPSAFGDSRPQSSWPHSLPPSVIANLRGADTLEPPPYATEARLGNKPSFMQKAEREQHWRKPHMRALLVAGLTGATVLLLLQGALAWRDTLASRYPAAKPLLASACSALGCQVQAARSIEQLTVESSGLVKAEQSAQYRLQVSLRNRSDMELALPALDVTVSDAQGEVIARKVLLPQDLGSTIDRQPGSHRGVLAAGQEITLQALLLAAGSEAQAVSGYTLELFYP